MELALFIGCLKLNFFSLKSVILFFLVFASQNIVNRLFIFQFRSCFKISISNCFMLTDFIFFSYSKTIKLYSNQ